MYWLLYIILKYEFYLFNSYLITTFISIPSMSLTNIHTKFFNHLNQNSYYTVYNLDFYTTFQCKCI